MTLVHSKGKWSALKRHLDIRRALDGHLGTRREIKHLKGAWTLGHSIHLHIWVLKHLDTGALEGHLGSWSSRGTLFGRLRPTINYVFRQEKLLNQSTGSLCNTMRNTFICNKWITGNVKWMFSQWYNFINFWYC